MKIIKLITLFLLFITPLFSESDLYTLTLNNNSKIIGNLVSENDEIIVFKVSSRELEIKKSNVKSLIKVSTLKTVKNKSKSRTEKETKSSKRRKKNKPRNDSLVGYESMSKWIPWEINQELYKRKIYFMSTLLSDDRHDISLSSIFGLIFFFSLFFILNWLTFSFFGLRWLSIPKYTKFVAYRVCYQIIYSFFVSFVLGLVILFFSKFGMSLKLSFDSNYSLFMAVLVILMYLAFIIGQFKVDVFVHKKFFELTGWNVFCKNILDTILIIPFILLLNTIFLALPFSFGIS